VIDFGRQKHWLLVGWSSANPTEVWCIYAMKAAKLIRELNGEQSLECIYSP
jgi:hypothetical protein